MLFINMLQNWEYLAQELNIKWAALLALDDDLYDELWFQNERSHRGISQCRVVRALERENSVN